LAPLLKNTEKGLWPVDKLLLAYFLFTTALVLGWCSRIPYALPLLAAHIGAAFLLLFEILWPNRTTWFFRHWYPLIYVTFCYKEMALLIPGVNPNYADLRFSNLDYFFWHAHPTVWLERITSPALTEYLQIIYTLFVPSVLLIAFLLWRQRRFAEFRYYAFLIALGFLVSYIGYLIFPARGPRFFLKHLQYIPLRGIWLFRFMQDGLDRLESTAYDCFPSGHTELTILAWWSARQFTNSLFWPYFAYTLSIISATVYLRYHYTIDVLAGVAVAGVLLIAAPSLYRNFQGKRGLQVGRS